MSSSPAARAGGRTLPMAVSCPFDRSGLLRSDDGTLWYGGQPETFTEALQRTVMERPDETAVIDQSPRSLSYAELWGHASRLAGGLRSAGLSFGDRVAIDLGNSIDWVVSFLGTILAGGVAVPLDQRATEESRRRIVADAEAAVILKPGAPLPVGSAFIHEPDPAQLAQMLYTSGTTGEPKGVMIGQRALASLGELTRRTYALDEKETLRNLIALPLSHAAACNAQLVPTLILGGTAILARSANATDVMDAACEHQANTMLAVPAVYKLIVQRERERLRSSTSLQRLVYGAAPVSKSLIAELQALRPESGLANAYGMTEISNMTMFLPSALAHSHSDSIGFAVPGVEAELRNIDPDGCGELYMRGPNMAAGYWRRAALTEEVFGTGWVRSGDVATIDDSGLVFLRDRTKDIINRAGEKIYALEVEQHLLRHPAVDDVAVMAVPDPLMGEKVGAVIVIAGEATITTEELATFARASLPRYAVPEHFILRRDPLPRGVSGKVRKVDLRRDVGWSV